MAGNTMRIVLLGKTGTGKSSLANTLLGEKDVFKEGGSSSSVTDVCKSETRNIYGRNIQLIDTPGFLDTDKNINNFKSDLLKCIVECAPGPHAFLLLFQVGRFTPQEQDVVNLIVNEYFGEEALKYTTVVFTHGDQLDEGQKIEKWAKENEALKNLLEKCQNRCYVFDNKYWKTNEDEYRNNQNQIKNLLDIIDQTVRDKGGRCYTNEVLQEVQNQIEEKKRKLKRSSPNLSLKELSRMSSQRQSSPNISEEELERMSRESVRESLAEKLINADSKIILSALLGGSARTLITAGAVVGAAAGPVGAVVGAAVGTAVGFVMSLLRCEKLRKSLKHK